MLASRLECTAKKKRRQSGFFFHASLYPTAWDYVQETKGCCEVVVVFLFLNTMVKKYTGPGHKTWLHSQFSKTHACNAWSKRKICWNHWNDHHLHPFNRTKILSCSNKNGGSWAGTINTRGINTGLNLAGRYKESWEQTQLFHPRIYNPIMFKLVNQLPLRGNNRSLSLPSGLTGSPLAPFLQMIGASHRFTRASHAGVASAWTHPDPLLPVRSSCSHLVLRRWHAAFKRLRVPKNIKAIQATMRRGNDYNRPPNWCVEHLLKSAMMEFTTASLYKINLTPTCEDKIRTILLSKNGTYCYMTTFTPYAALKSITQDIARFKMNTFMFYLALKLIKRVLEMKH